MIIYKATNVINNKVYIGQTIYTLNYRRKQHERSINYKNKYAFTKAIEKYGKENFVWEIIDTANSIEELNEKEAFYIKKYKSLISENGYNLKTGGKNNLLSDETKIKISKAQIGEKNHMFGKKGENNPTSKKVINLNTNIIYESATECANKENINLSHVCAVCRGERSTTNNQTYRYLDNNNNIIPPKKNIKPHKKRIKNVETNEIFNTITEAEIKYKGKKLGTLNRVCDKPNLTFAGYHWISI